jgi:ATP-dependent DNA ligase
MPSTFDFCLPSSGKAVPSGPDWVHEIKYDGFRVRLERDGDRARLITRGGYNWLDRYPWIVETARRIRQTQFVIDGEAVVLGVDGVSDFDALISRRHDDEVQLYAFDLLALEGDDLRKLPLSLRKTDLARLLARQPEVRAKRRALPVVTGKSSRARSVPTCSMRRAGWGWRAWSRSIAADLPGWPVRPLDQGQEPEASRVRHQFGVYR